MVNLQANNAAGGARARFVCVLRRGQRHESAADLSRVLNGSRDAGNPAAYTGGTNTWTNSTLAGRLVRTNPLPTTSEHDAFSTGTGSRRRSGRQPVAPAKRARGRTAGELLRRQPSREPGEHHRQRRIQHLPRHAARVAAAAVARAAGQRAATSTRSEEGSTFLGFHFGRRATPPTDRCVTPSRRSGTGRCRSATASGSAPTRPRSSTPSSAAGSSTASDASRRAPRTSATSGSSA